MLFSHRLLPKQSKGMSACLLDATRAQLSERAPPLYADTLYGLAQYAHFLCTNRFLLRAHFSRHFYNVFEEICTKAMREHDYKAVNYWMPMSNESNFYAAYKRDDERVDKVSESLLSTSRTAFYLMGSVAQWYSCVSKCF